MGKKKGLAAIFSKPKPPGSPSSPPWSWPSCANNPQTSSFRRNDRSCATASQSGPKAAGDMYKTVNSVYFDPADDSFSIDEEEEEDEFGDALDSYSTTTVSKEWSEAVIRSLGRRTRTDRFFFDSPASNSILAASREPKAAPAAEMPDSDEEPPPPPSPLVEESVAVALDSDDPYGDFRASMEEMVAAHGLRDWASLQEMLLCYLRINAKHNHALILGAFVDLLVGLASSSSGADTTATTTTATETSSSGWSTSSVAGDGATCSSTAATTGEEEPEHCGGSSGTGASCSASAASSDQEDDLALHMRIRLSSS